MSDGNGIHALSYWLDVLEMCLDGRGAQVDRPPDLGSGQTSRDQPEHLILPVAQEGALVDRAHADLACHAGLQVGSHDRLATGNGGDGVADLARLRVLGQVSGSPVRDRLIDIAGGRLGRDQQNSGVQPVAAHGVQDLLAGEAGKVALDQRDVRLLGVDRLERPATV